MCLVNDRLLSKVTPRFRADVEGEIMLPQKTIISVSHSSISSLYIPSLTFSSPFQFQLFICFTNPVPALGIGGIFSKFGKTSRQILKTLMTEGRQFMILFRQIA